MHFRWLTNDLCLIPDMMVFEKTGNGFCVNAENGSDDGVGNSLKPFLTLIHVI